jgi:cytochrome P450
MNAPDASGAVCPFAAQEFKPFDTRDPFGFYQQARQEEPVFFSPELGYWVVTRFSDAQAIFKDPQTFSSREHANPVQGPSAGSRACARGGWV